MREGMPQFVFPKPGKTLIGVMLGLFCIWIIVALGVNWAGVSPALMEPFVGQSSLVLSGQIWRLLTAALIHDPNSPWHVLMTILGIYFLGTSLEERWGGKRMVLFLGGSAVLAFAFQAIFGTLIPRLDVPVWYGGLGMIEAVAVAWALQARNSQVRLFFVLPVSGNMLLIFVFVMSVLNVIAARAPSEGLVTPFGGMLAGYLFGDVSPLRRWYLQWRFKQLQAQSAALRSAPTSAARRKASGFRVIQGGKDDDEGPPSDKRYLN
jgi:membrane associated rhomboid family serine protease